MNSSRREHLLATVSPRSTPTPTSFTPPPPELRYRQLLSGTEEWLTGNTFAWLVIAVGVVLRIVAYAAPTSMWLDEILLSRNILGLSLGQLLTEPLHLDQVAPRGFLLFTKVSTMVAGETELSLRLFAFLCGIASLVLFRRLAERTLNGLGAPIALVLFAIGVPFIRYAVQVKQYESDVAFAIVIMLLGLRVSGRDQSTRQLLLAGLAGFVVIWFSQAAVIVMAGVGAGLTIDWLLSRDRRAARATFIVVPLWAMASVVAIVVGLRTMTPATRAFMDDFWRPGFVPRPLELRAAATWSWQRVVMLFGEVDLLHYRWPIIFAVLAVVGVVWLWQRRRIAALVVTAPLILAFVAAAAHQYPMRGRVMTFLLPTAVLLAVAGADWVRALASRLHPALGIATAVAMLAAPVQSLVATPPPYEIEHTRTMLEYLRQHRQPGDVIHVFPLARMGVTYYGPQYGLRPDEWNVSVCSREDTRAFIRDVDRYRGASRVWLLSAQVRPFRTARPAVRSYLGTIGVRRDALVLPSLTMGEVSLELFDLSDPARLAASTAESFPVSPMPTDPRPGCRPWTRPSPEDAFR